MFVLYESALKQRFSDRGVATPPGGVAANVAGVLDLASSVGYPAVLKAVVPIGDRGGKGLVKVVDSPAECGLVAEELLSASPLGHQVSALRVERCIMPGDEYYIAYTFDFVAGVPLLLWGDGGSDVEHWLVPSVQPFHLSTGPDLEAVPSFIRGVAGAAFDVFVDLQARFVELNPVRVTGGESVVLDAKAVLDPYRRPPPDAIAIEGEPTEGDVELKRRLAALGTTCTVRYEEFDGDIGLVMWGGGSTMVVLDALERRSLLPANYSDMAAGSKQFEAIGVLADVVLSRPLRGALVGSTVSSAMSALALARVVRESVERRTAATGVHIPVAVRLAGEDDDQATALLEALPNVRHFGRDSTLEDAVAWLAGSEGQA